MRHHVVASNFNVKQFEGTFCSLLKEFPLWVLTMMSTILLHWSSQPHLSHIWEGQHLETFWPAPSYFVLLWFNHSLMREAAWSLVSLMSIGNLRIPCGCQGRATAQLLSKQLSIALLGQPTQFCNVTQQSPAATVTEDFYSHFLTRLLSQGHCQLDPQFRALGFSLHLYLKISCCLSAEPSCALQVCLRVSISTGWDAMGSGQFIQDDYAAEIQRRACFKESKCGNYWLGLGFQQVSWVCCLSAWQLRIIHPRHQECRGQGPWTMELDIFSDLRSQGLEHYKSYISSNSELQRSRAYSTGYIYLRKVTMTHNRPNKGWWVTQTLCAPGDRGTEFLLTSASCLG